MAVPMIVKIPEPITAPMPRAVRLSQPSDFFNRTSAFSESDSSWSMPLQRKRGDATRTLQSNQCELRLDRAPQCTLRGELAQQRLPALHLFQLGVAFDKFFCAASRKTNGEPPVLIVAFDADDGANSVVRMANFLAEKGIGVGAAFYGGAQIRVRTSGTARGRRRNRLNTHATKKFIRGLRRFRVGFIAARLADLRHRATHRLHEFARNFRQESRWQRSPQLLLIAKDATAHCPGERAHFPADRIPP